MQISDQQEQNTSTSDINAIACILFETLALRFPVCMSSDEFHYYPQVTIIDKDWALWDEFSPESVTDILLKLSEFKNKLDYIASCDLTFDEQVDISLLKRTMITISEQLEYVKPHKTQRHFI